VTPLALLPLGTALVAFVTGVLVLRPASRTPLSRPLAGVMFSATWWGVAGAAATAAADRPAVAADLLAALVPSAASLVAFGAWHSIGFAGRADLWTRRTAALLAVEPALVVLAALTNRRTGWLVELVPEHPSGLGFGVGFWVHTAYCYALIGVMCVLLLIARGRAVRGQRAHLDLVIGIIALPLVANVYCLVALPTRWVDATSGAFVVTALVWLGAERAATALRQGPVSTVEVIHAIGDGVLVLDVNERVVEVNPEAERLLAEVLGVPGPHTGRLLRDVVPVSVAEAGAGGTPVEAGGRTFDVRVTRVRRAGQVAALVVVVRDITEIASLRARLEAQARTDALTGLANRHDLDQVLDDAVTRAREAGRPLTFAMADVDRFKRVNDEHGHAAGDRVLRAVAATLRAVPGAGAVIRFGGEEFLVLLPDVPADEAVERLDAARRACAALRVRGRGGDLAVTISVGIALLEQGETAEAGLAAADAALYAAKEAGRNRVEVALPRG
jgi:diguanylate cyclase (GGDEF)-like protein